MNRQIYILDSCALIAYYQLEEGALEVKQLLEQAAREEIIIIMHAATITEVYTDFLKRGFAEDAANFLQEIKSKHPVIIQYQISDNLIADLAYFKANFKISFADSFVLATAKINDATIITSDHHEFDAIDKKGVIKFKWIR